MKELTTQPIVPSTYINHHLRVTMAAGLARFPRYPSFQQRFPVPLEGSWGLPQAIQHISSLLGSPSSWSWLENLLGTSSSNAWANEARSLWREGPATLLWAPARCLTSSPQSCAFSHYPKLVSTGEGCNVDLKLKASPSSRSSFPILLWTKSKEFWTLFHGVTFPWPVFNF